MRFFSVMFFCNYLRSKVMTNGVLYILLSSSFLGSFLLEKGVLILEDLLELPCVGKSLLANSVLKSFP